MNSCLLLFAAAFVAAVSGSAVYPAVAHLGPITSQYHSQDGLGHYAYGYSGGPSAKQEQRTADGVTSGGYSYVDANGLLQSVAYVSDPHNGFRASGTNFPVDKATEPVAPVVHDVVPAPTPVHPWPAVVHDVVPAPAPVHSWPAVVAAAPEPIALPTVVEARNYVPVHHFAPQPYIAPAPYVAVHEPAPAPVATSYTSVVHHHQPEPVPAPEPVIAYAATPVEIPAPVPHVYAEPHVAVLPTKSQYHSQDEHGQYTYGYTDGASAKTETRYADGETKGSYSYVDNQGDVQAVHYSAGVEGFKAAGTNIPVHHV